MAQFYTEALKTKEIMVLIRDKRDGVFILPPPAPKFTRPWLRAWTPDDY